MRLDRRLTNHGYGSRREIAGLLEAGRITRADGCPVQRNVDAPHSEIFIDGEPLDPPPPFTILLHKPCGYTCSTSEAGRLVYDLLPPRFSRRRPVLAVAGRLDKETSGLVILTDDGALLHRIISPRKSVWKTYDAVLSRPLAGHEVELFSSGTLQLHGEKEPCAPARLEPLGERRVRLHLTEGRYHQVRRMFAAVGNHVEHLRRIKIGSLSLGDLPEGKWTPLTPEEIERATQPHRHGE
jgi:16S rRNA pseudouridine516 synthase